VGFLRGFLSVGLMAVSSGCGCWMGCPSGLASQLGRRSWPLTGFEIADAEM